MSQAVAESDYRYPAADIEEQNKVRDGVREFERERRRLKLATFGTGWAFGGLMFVIAAGLLTAVIRRPIPQDHLYLSFVSVDGTSPPILREDLDQTRRDIVLDNTLIEYVKAREGYVWESENANYRRVMSVSSKEEQRRYSAQVLDKNNPARPEAVYGTGAAAGTAEPINIKISRDASAPFSAVAYYTLRVTMPNRPPMDVRKVAKFSWQDAQDVIPIEVQREFDQLGIMFTQWSSFPLGGSN